MNCIWISCFLKGIKWAAAFLNGSGEKESPWKLPFPCLATKRHCGNKRDFVAAMPYFLVSISWFEDLPACFGNKNSCNQVMRGWKPVLLSPRWNTEEHNPSEPGFQAERKGLRCIF